MHTALIALALTVLGGHDEPPRCSFSVCGLFLPNVPRTNPVYSPYINLLRKSVIVNVEPAWFKIVDGKDGKKCVRQMRSEELPGLLEEIGRIKRLVDDPQFKDKPEDRTQLLIRLQDRIEELIYSDLPLGRFVRVGIAP
jgi:hypothetical protein